MPIDWGPMGEKKQAAISNYEENKRKRRERRKNLRQVLSLIDQFGFREALKHINVTAPTAAELRDLAEAADLIEQDILSDPTVAERMLMFSLKWDLIEPDFAPTTAARVGALHSLMRAAWVERLVKLA